MTKQNKEKLVPNFGQNINIGSAMNGPILVTDSQGNMWCVDGLNGKATKIEFELTA